MLHASHVSSLEKVYAFQAPTNAPVSPYIIPANREVVELLTGGRVFDEQDGKREAFGRGTMFWHLPGERTIYQKDLRKPYTCVTFTFKTLGHTVRSVPRRTTWRNQEEVGPFVQKVIKAYFDDSCDRDVLGGYIYWRLLWEAYDHSRAPATAGLPDCLHTLLECMEKNLEREWSLEAMAELAKVSIPSIHLLFKKHLQKSPHQYLLGRRIQEARTLLATTDIPVKEISFLCGFKNIETFYRTFKRQLNLPPLKYRQKHLPPGYQTARIS